MHKRPGASQRASSLQSASFSVRRKTQPCTAHLSLPASHRRKLDFTVTHVANCEKPLSIKEPNEDDSTIVQVVTPNNKAASSTEAAAMEASPLGEKLETMFSVMWMCAALVSGSFFILTGVYGLIDAMTEWQMLLVSSIPFFWSWIRRFKEFKIHWRNVLGMTVRLMLMGLMLTTNAYQIRTFIFMHDRAILPVAGIVTGVTLTAHWLLRSKAHPLPTELRKPDTDLLAPFLSDDVETVGKVATRLSMIWVYLLGVLIVPFVQEIMFRGVVAISLGHVSSGVTASLLAAVTFQLSQPVESVRNFLTTLATHTVWGLLVMATGGNLMYSYVAHMMHNAALLGIYHYESLIESW